MKTKFIIALLFALASVLPSPSQVNVQKTSGTNALTGNIVVGTGKTITTTGTGTISGSGITPSLTATYVGYGSAGGILTGEAAFNYTAGTDTLAIGVLSATGNVTGGNLTTGGLVSATGNVTGGNLTTGGLASVTGNLTAGNITTAGALSAGSINGSVTLNASGPQLSSSIVARAPSQGLVFDGTTSATMSFTGGAGDFTFAWLSRARIFHATYSRLFHNASGSAFGVYEDDGQLFLAVADVVFSGAVMTVGKAEQYTYVRTIANTGTEGKLYRDGVLVSTIADANNYSNATINYGGYTAHYFDGVLNVLGGYNRALTAAEVVSLWESGSANAADYNSAGTTNANGTWANSGVQAFDTFTPTLGTSFIAASAATATAGSTITAVGVGKRVQVAYNVSAYASGTPKLYLAADKDQLLATALSNVVTMTTTAGVNYAELVSTSASADTLVVEGVGASDFTIESFAVVYSGLLLAPDATQFGSGLAWQDTSGNNADITLPATGVEWALPSSGTISLGPTKATQATIVGSSAGALTITPYAGTNVTIANTNTALSLAGTTTSTSATTGSLLMVGGIGINNSTDASSSTNGGTITTAGGVAIAKKLYVGTDAAVGGNLTASGTGSHVFGTTNTVTMAAGAVTATGTITGLGVVAAGNATTSSELQVFRTATDVSNALRYLTASTINWSVGSGLSGTNTDYEVYNAAGSLTAFKLANTTGNATFAGSVTSTSATGSVTLGAATEVASFAVGATGAATITNKAGQTMTFASGSGGAYAFTGTGTATFAGGVTVGGAVITTPQALTGSGAINLTTAITVGNSTGGGAWTIADGTNGQIKTITMAVDGGDATLTPDTTKTGFSTITFDAVGDSVTLQFYTTYGWMVVANYNATVNAP
jgi:filamentous hemagglutinin